ALAPEVCEGTITAGGLPSGPNGTTMDPVTITTLPSAAAPHARVAVARHGVHLLLIFFGSTSGHKLATARCGTCICTASARSMRRAARNARWLIAILSLARILLHCSFVLAGPVQRGVHDEIASGSGALQGQGESR